jgi:hypothetical protein
MCRYVTGYGNTILRMRTDRHTTGEPRRGRPCTVFVARTPVGVDPKSLGGLKVKANHDRQLVGVGSSGAAHGRLCPRRSLH